MQDLVERIAVLETKVDAYEESHKAILTKLETIDNNLSRYKGFVGGVAFVISAVVTFMSFAKDYIVKHWLT